MAIITARPVALIVASHASNAAHLFALVAAILVLVWAIHFGGGLSLHSDNEALVFNVRDYVPRFLASFQLLIIEFEFVTIYKKYFGYSKRAYTLQ